MPRIAADGALSNVVTGTRSANREKGNHKMTSTDVANELGTEHFFRLTVGRWCRHAPSTSV
jgi:hypothetical protein